MTVKVFLVDDHAVVREGLCSLLEAEKDIHIVGESGDGRDAVRQVQRLCPDIVIMDIAMPNLNGIEATRQIVETCPSTQVIILSMYSSNEHISEALKSGAMGYILKGSSAQEVIEAVRVVKSGGHYLSQPISEMVIEEYLNPDRTGLTHSPLEKLSSREREILQLVVEGKSSAEIAEILYISPKTVETYRSRLMQKLQIKDLPSLVKFGIKHGLITIDT